LEPIVICKAIVDKRKKAISLRIWGDSTS